MEHTKHVHRIPLVRIHQCSKSGFFLYCAIFQVFFKHSRLRRELKCRTLPCWNTLVEAVTIFFLVADVWFQGCWGQATCTCWYKDRTFQKSTECCGCLLYKGQKTFLSKRRTLSITVCPFALIEHVDMDCLDETTLLRQLWRGELRILGAG